MFSYCSTQYNHKNYLLKWQLRSFKLGFLKQLQISNISNNLKLHAKYFVIDKNKYSWHQLAVTIPMHYGTLPLEFLRNIFNV